MQKCISHIPYCFSITPVIETPLLLKHFLSSSYTHSYCAFCCCALAAFAAFLRLLRTMTTLRKLPTTAPPSSSRMTGMRMAQTRGGKRDWIACESSTKGCEDVELGLGLGECQGREQLEVQ